MLKKILVYSLVIVILFSYSGCSNELLDEDKEVIAEDKVVSINIFS